MILKAARELWDLGWAVLWLEPRSKKPVGTGWTKGPRKTWAELEREYQALLKDPRWRGQVPNLGVRTGEPSRLAAGTFLANVDIDVKSGRDDSWEEAWACVRSAFPQLDLQTVPMVRTPYGARLFVATKEPVKGWEVGRAADGDECLAFMPSLLPKKKGAAPPAMGRVGETIGGKTLTAKMVAEGWCVRPSWTVDVMSTGRQVVLPPSIHPETLKPYVWEQPLAREAPPLLETPTGKSESRHAAKTSTGAARKAIAQKFTVVNVDLAARGVPDETVRMIVSGDGADDRSAALLKVCKKLASRGFTDDEILSVLTDPAHSLASAGLDRRGGDRQSAGAWVREYSLEPAKRDLAPSFSAVTPVQVRLTITGDDDAGDDLGESMFGETVSPDSQGATGARGADGADLLSEEEAQRQREELQSHWTTRIKRSKTKDGEPGKPLGTLENTVLVLENAASPDVFRLDQFAMREVFGPDTPWAYGEYGKAGQLVSDEDLGDITLWLGQNYQFEPPQEKLEKAVKVIARRNAYHPVRRELEALPPWDGKPRLDTWLRDFFGAAGPVEYTGAVFTKWLVASVARTYQPGIKFDWMPIFENREQGVGKSRIGPLLFGKKYFRDDLPPLENKDAEFGLEGYRVIEMGELANLGRAEVNVVKSFLARQTARQRRSYGKREVELQRQCVFFGTTNEHFYLKDRTGNRRFMPIEVGVLNERQLRKDRDQLWAEALAIWRSGEVDEGWFFLKGKAAEHAKSQQKAKLIPDESEAMAEDWMGFVRRELNRRREDPAARLFPFERFKLVTLFEPMGPFSRWKVTQSLLMQAGRALTECGATKTMSKGKAWWKFDLEVAERVIAAEDAKGAPDALGSGETVSPGLDAEDMFS